MLETIIKVSAEWCSPCKHFAPIFEKVSKEEKYSNINFSEVDIEEDENGIVEKFNIRSVPTILFLDKENNVIQKLIGSMTETDFTSYIDKIMEK